MKVLKVFHMSARDFINIVYNNKDKVYIIKVTIVDINKALHLKEYSDPRNKLFCQYWP